MIKKKVKSSKTKEDNNVQGISNKAIRDFFSRNFPSQRVAGYIQTAEWEKSAARSTLSSKAIIQNRGEIKSFQGKQKLKEYATIRPDLQEILRGIL